jgi:hypothetical protein
MAHVTLAVQSAGPVRTEELMGRPYRVFPAVLVREQVLHNNLGHTFLPAEEIRASVEAWNGIPVVIRHPQSRGVPVSARSPEVLNARGAGFLFRARYEDAALHADVFLDMERAADIPDTGDVINRVDSGDVGELSTGFGTTVENVKGTWGGQAFDLILRAIQPDHLALLPDEVGACSVADGCGLGVNAEAGDDMATDDGVVATNVQDPPEVEAVAKDTRWRGFFRSVAGFFGFRIGQNESDEDRRQMLSAALREKYGAEDRFIYVESVDSTTGTVVWSVEVQGEGDGAGLFQAAYETADDGSVTVGEPEKVRRVTQFEPVANAGDQIPGGDDMDRAQMIAHLAGAGRDTEALNKLSDCDLKALMGTTAANAEPQGDSEAWKLAHKYRQELEELRQQTANAVETENQEKARLLDDVLYTKGRPWSDAEVQNMDIRELRKVHQALCQRADYSLRGGPRASNAGGDFSFVRGIMDGPDSVLDRKEAN